MSRVSIRSAAVLASVWLSGGALAAPISATQLMSEYNLIVLGDAVNPDNDPSLITTETEGTVYVGGDFFGVGPYGVNTDALPNGATFDAAFVVGGDFLGEARLFSGDALFAGAQTGTLHNNGGGLVKSGPVDSAGVKAALEGLSSAYSALSDTGGSISGGQNAKIDVAAGLGGTAVYSLSSDVLNSFSSLEIMSDGKPVIINVSGDSVSLGSGFNFNGAFPSVVFNFFEATEISLSAAFSANVLAPFADAELLGGRVQGTAVFANLHQQRIEVDGPLFDAHVMPLPGGLALMLTGLLGFGFASRQRS